RLKNHADGLDGFAPWSGAPSAAEAARLLLPAGQGSANEAALNHRAHLLERGRSPAAGTWAGGPGQAMRGPNPTSTDKTLAKRPRTAGGRRFRPPNSQGVSPLPARTSVEPRPALTYNGFRIEE